MIVDKGSAELERHVRVRAARAVIRMCPDHGEILPMLGLAPDGSVLPPPGDAAHAGPAGRTAPPAPDAADAPRTPGMETDLLAQCRKGHPRAGGNTRISPSGRTICRVCESAARLARRDRNRAAAAGVAPDHWPDRAAAAAREAAAALGISGRRYRREYGVSIAVAEAVVEAVRLGDYEMVELLRKRPAA